MHELLGLMHAIGTDKSFYRTYNLLNPMPAIFFVRVTSLDLSASSRSPEQEEEEHRESKVCGYALHRLKVTTNILHLHVLGFM
ncbi:hypothetical protein FKM82_027137 [Ascaphus truei]